MEYTYDSRRKLYENYIQNWKKRLLLSSGKTKELAEKIDGMHSYQYENRTFLSEAENEYINGQRGILSDFFRKNYKQLVNVFVDKKYIEDFYRVLDKQNQFPYSKGWYRRTVRSESYSPFV